MITVLTMTISILQNDPARKKDDATDEPHLIVVSNRDTRPSCVRA